MRLSLAVISLPLLLLVAGCGNHPVEAPVQPSHPTVRDRTPASAGETTAKEQAASVVDAEERTALPDNAPPAEQEPAPVARLAVAAEKKPMAPKKQDFAAKIAIPTGGPGQPGLSGSIRMDKGGGAAKMGTRGMKKFRAHGRARVATSRSPRPGLLAPPVPDGRELDREQYDAIEESPFQSPADAPLSTFSIDVDTASYSNVRRILREGRMPPKDAVRIEELVNYFPYSYEPPSGRVPFATHVDVTTCPWNADHRLVRVGLKGRVLDDDDRPSANLVFLLDVSGSMNRPDKLPLLKQAFSMLVNNLRDDDRVSIVVYAGAAGLVLPPTSGADKPRIMSALDELRAGGSTNGGAGIQLAYKLAREQFVKGGVNRVMLATDGDFNVGTSSKGELVRMVTEEAKSGVFLTVLGFGRGNLQDATMEAISGKGNGTYAYIDSAREARKVLVEQVGSTLMTIAKDVKIQVEFNPAHVAGYRLVGYENRRLAARDFNDDKKDAGEIGAGHTVTAFYEIVPVGKPIPGPSIDPLKYQTARKASAGSGSPELLTLKLRYKQPEGRRSKLIEVPVVDEGGRLRHSDSDLRFAAAVATFGMLLSGSSYVEGASYDLVLELAEEARGADKQGHRGEFMELVRTAQRLGSER